MFRPILSTSDRKSLHPISGTKHLKTPLQARNLWRGSSRIQEHYNDRGQRRMKIHRRFDMVRMWGRPTQHWPAQIYNRHHPWWNWAKNWEQSIPEHKRTRPQKDFWGDEGACIQRRMAQIKKEIETDPYGALFGRRLEPFSALNKFEDTCASLYRSLFGLDRSGNTESTDTTARSQTSKNSPTKNPEGKSRSPRKPENEGITDSPQEKNTIPYEFDPVSGRMVQKKPGLTDEMPKNGPAGRGLTSKPTSQEPETPRKRNGYLSSMDRTGIKSRATPVEFTSSGALDKSPQEPKPENNPESRNESEQTPLASSKTDDGLCEPPRRSSSPGKAAMTTENETDQHRFSEIIPDKDQIQNIETKLPDSSNAALPGDSPQEKPKKSNVKTVGRGEKEKAEDLDILQASDIRSRYDPGKFQRASGIQAQMNSESNAVSKPCADPARDVFGQDARKQSEPPAQKQHPDATAPGTMTPDQANSTEPRHPKNFDHTQSPPSPTTIPSAEVYRVLAYDPSTLQISHAEASTSLHQANEPCHPSEVLSRLNNPAKFLPHFAKLHADGYEISSGGGDILVFRKSFAKRELTGSSLEQLATEAQDIKAHLRNEPLLDELPLGKPKPVSDQHVAQSTDDAASADLPRPRASDERSSQRNKDKFFENKSTIGNAARRMFISGAATAATCYAIGVVIEYFRTGGEYGLGIDAFTEFESERRRRNLGQTE